MLFGAMLQALVGEGIEGGGKQKKFQNVPPTFETPVSSLHECKYLSCDEEYQTMVICRLKH